VTNLGGGFHPYGEDFQFGEHIFQTWLILYWIILESQVARGPIYIFPDGCEEFDSQTLSSLVESAAIDELIRFLKAKVESEWIDFDLQNMHKYPTGN